MSSTSDRLVDRITERVMARLQASAPSSSSSCQCSPAPAGPRELRDMVEHVRAPAWVPMRAATCLATRHGATVQDDLLAWVSDEATLGLGMHLLNHLDDMEEAVANAVAERALRDGPEALEAPTRIARSSRPSTQA